LERKAGAQLGAAAGSRLDDEAAAFTLNPVTHTEQAIGTDLRSAYFETDPVIDD
jgi:hypothetical protein